MKKPTLKHAQPDGSIATRTTARKYTHVLLCKVDNAIALRAHEAKLSDTVARVTKDTRDQFAEYQTYLRTEVGAPIPYRPGQGGFRRFADGTFAMYPMPDYLPELAREFFAKHGDTVEACVVSHVQAAIIRHQVEARNISARNEAWQVISWHSAAKHAKPGYIGPGDQFRVEEINNGTRA